MTVRIGVLWDDEMDHEGDSPMRKQKRNDRYGTFSEVAGERDAEVYLANYQRYEEAELSEAYRWNGESWDKEKEVELDVVFDKFKFDNETRELKKRMQRQLPVLNAFELEEICKDKLMTYERFPDYVPETAFADREKAEEFLEKDGKLVLKPRYGFGGHGVSVIDSMEEFEEEPNLLVQRYVDPSGGTPHFDFEGAHDFRVMIVNGEPMACYYRLNDEGDTANVSQGAVKKFVDVDEIPENVMDAVEDIAGEFSGIEPVFYSVDFMFDSEGKPWIIELNSKPGLSIDDEESRRHKLPVMEKVVDILVEMAQS